MRTNRVAQRLVTSATTDVGHASSSKAPCPRRLHFSATRPSPRLSAQGHGSSGTGQRRVRHSPGPVTAWTSAVAEIWNHPFGNLTATKLPSGPLAQSSLFSPASCHGRITRCASTGRAQKEACRLLTVGSCRRTRSQTSGRPWKKETRRSKLMTDLTTLQHGSIPPYSTKVLRNTTRVRH